MLLSRLILVPLLVAATAPCMGQPGPAKQSPALGTQWRAPKTQWQGPRSFAFNYDFNPGLSLALRNRAQTALRKLETAESGACYALRDYKFAIQSGPGVPTLKGYSTCESASLFHMREVTASSR